MLKRRLTGILYFYQKLVVPSAAVSLLLAVFAVPVADLPLGAGIAYLVITPAFHYFMYDIWNPGEYLYYFNLGLSRIVLWIATVSLSMIPCITAIAL